MRIGLSGRSTVVLFSLLTLVPMIHARDARAFTLVEQYKMNRIKVAPVSTVRFNDFTATDFTTRIKAGAAVIKETSGRIVDNGMSEVTIDREGSDAITKELGIDKEETQKAVFDANRRIFVFKDNDGQDTISFGGFVSSLAYMKGSTVDQALSKLNDSTIIGLLVFSEPIKAIANSLDFGNSYISIPGLLRLFGIFGATNLSEEGLYNFGVKGGWAVTSSTGQKIIRTDIGYAAVLTAIVQQ